MPDHLSHQPYIDLLKSIIANQCNNPTGYSFAIDGEWGSGKTWILNELEKQLADDGSKKYLIFHYNAWENDFYEEPLVAILSVMIEKLNTVIKQKTLCGSVLDELIKDVSYDLLNVISAIGKLVAQIEIKKSIKNKICFFKRVKEGRNISSKDINTFSSLQNILQVVRENIAKLSEKLHIVLVVDELDRCLPEYAIKVLERLHHICNEMPVIQIIAINKQHLADSIAKVFGKDYSHDKELSTWNSLFCESYLQKFVDMIIPLPNGEPNKRIEVLNGLEEEFSPYNHADKFGQDFIRVDDEFLAEFISSLMNGIERRLQEKIFKQVALCHKLTIQSGVQYDKDNMSYAVLIYEIISCICRYVYHSKETCELLSSNMQYSLRFYREIHSSIIKKTTDQIALNKNLSEYLYSQIYYHDTENGPKSYDFEIGDTKTYIMAFFTKLKNFSYDPLQNLLWRGVLESKIFLQKYDEIINFFLC